MKIRALVVVLGVIMLITALVFVALPELGMQPVGLAVALAFIAGISVVNVWASRRQHRSLLREVTKVDNRLSRVEYRTQPVHDIRGSVAKTSTETRETLRLLREFADDGFPAANDTVGQGGVPQSGTSNRSIFSPVAVRAGDIRDRPKMHNPGRDAARQDMKVPGESNLVRLLLASETDLNREIAFIGGDGLIPTLESVGTVSVISPGMGKYAISDSTAFLVVDIATLNKSAWSGALDASRTRLFQELRTIVESARKRGAAVILHGVDVPSHFTASLENLAHANLRGHGFDHARWGDDVSSAVIGAIENFDARTRQMR